MLKRLAYLKRYDVYFLLFGAGAHKYRFAPVLKEEEVCAFERENRVALPKEYREFLKTYGNGGAGPGYGLLPLRAQALMDRPFLLPGSVEFDQDDCAAPDCGGCGQAQSCLFSDFADGAYWDAFRYQQGSLAICFEGCSYYRRLVLNGPFAGEVWAESEGEGMKRVDHSFSCFYEKWLDEACSAIRPYVEALDARAPFSELMGIPGRGKGMFYFAHIKAEFVAGVIGEGPRGKEEKQAYISRIGKAYERWRKAPAPKKE